MIGDLNLQWVALFNEGGVALHLDGANIKGGAYLNPVTATGEVRAFGATIGGQLVLEGAALTNEGGKALSLDWADIKSSTSLSRLAAIGEVRGLEATISGQLDLEGATLSNNDGAALALRSARLGYVKLAPAAVTGPIRLDAAQIAILVAPDDMTV